MLVVEQLFTTPGAINLFSCVLYAMCRIFLLWGDSVQVSVLDEITGGTCSFEKWLTTSFTLLLYLVAIVIEVLHTNSFY